MASEGSNTGLYVLIILLIFLVVGAVLYFGGVFNKKTEIDINVTKPGVVLLVAASSPVDGKVKPGDLVSSGSLR